MENKVANLINHHLSLIKNPKNKILLKVEIGKSPFASLVKLFKVIPELRSYLQEKGQFKGQKKYYQYQYQDKYFRRYKTQRLETEVYQDIFLGSVNHHDDRIDVRFSLHQLNNLELFSQHLAFHNICFITEEIWEINHLQIILKKEKKNNLEVETFYFQVSTPLGSGQLENLKDLLNDVNDIFRNIIDNKEKSQTLDLILESEQLLQEANQDI